MAGTLDFRYDAWNDVVVVISPWRVETEADLEPWYQEWANYFNSNARVRLFVNTSGVRYDVSACEAATIEDAIEAIREERRREGGSPVGTPRGNPVPD